MNSSNPCWSIYSPTNFEFAPPNFNFPDHIPKISYSEVTGLAYLSRGGYGTIFKAKYMNKNVAIKVQNYEGLKVLYNEITHLLNLSNVNHVINLLGFYISENGENSRIVDGIVLELLPEGTLENIIQKKNRIFVFEYELNLQNAFYFAYFMVKAIEYIHKNNVVHKDLKPNNVLINLDHIRSIADIKLIDFGLALDFTKEYDDLAYMLGNPFWLAPELIDEEPKYSKESEIYTLGLILHYIITRELHFDPYEDLDNIGKMLKYKQDVESGKRLPYFPEKYHEIYNRRCRCYDCIFDVPFERSLYELIVSCLHHSPAKRPSALELLDRLENLGKKTIFAKYYKTRKHDTNAKYMNGNYVLKQNKCYKVQCENNQNIVQTVLEREESIKQLEIKLSKTNANRSSIDFITITFNGYLYRDSLEEKYRPYFRLDLFQIQTAKLSKRNSKNGYAISKFDEFDNNADLSNYKHSPLFIYDSKAYVPPRPNSSWANVELPRSQETNRGFSSNVSINESHMIYITPQKTHLINDILENSMFFFEINTIVAEKMTNLSFDNFAAIMEQISVLQRHFLRYDTKMFDVESLSEELKIFGTMPLAVKCAEIIAEVDKTLQIYGILHESCMLLEVLADPGLHRNYDRNAKKINASPLNETQIEQIREKLEINLGIFIEFLSNWAIKDEPRSKELCKLHSRNQFQTNKSNKKKKKSPINHEEIANPFICTYSDICDAKYSENALGLTEKMEKIVKKIENYLYNGILEPIDKVSKIDADRVPMWNVPNDVALDVFQLLSKIEIIGMKLVSVEWNEFFENYKHILPRLIIRGEIEIDLFPYQCLRDSIFNDKPNHILRTHNLNEMNIEEIIRNYFTETCFEHLVIVLGQSENFIEEVGIRTNEKICAKRLEVFVHDFPPEYQNLEWVINNFYFSEIVYKPFSS